MKNSSTKTKKKPIKKVQPKKIAIKKTAIVTQKSRPKAIKVARVSPCIATPNQPHQCAYMNTVWSFMLRGACILQDHYTGFQTDPERGIYLPHIYELVSLLKPAHLAWPHMIPTEKQESFDWALALYESWLRTKNKRTIDE